MVIVCILFTIVCNSSQVGSSLLPHQLEWLTPVPSPNSPLVTERNLASITNSRNKSLTQCGQKSSREACSTSWNPIDAVKAAPQTLRSSDAPSSSRSFAICFLYQTSLIIDQEPNTSYQAKLLSPKVQLVPLVANSNVSLLVMFVTKPP